MTNQDSNPSSWLSLELGEVIDYGQTEKIEPDNISSETWVLELEDIERDTSRLLKRLTYAERPSKSTKNSFSPGDILYGKLRPYLNKVIYADASGVCSTEIIPLKPNLAVDSRYLFHWIRHPEFLAYTSQVSHGVNMPRLGTEAGRQAPFILAPINEQRRIADKLDRVLARVDTANEHLSRVAPLIKRFRQSVLAAATSGRLTEDWRKHAEYKTTTVRMDDIGKVTGGLTKNAKRAELPLRKAYLRVANVYSNEVRLEDVLEIGLTESEYEKTKLTYGDLLIVEGNGSIDQIGRVAMWKDEIPECTHQNHLIRWRRSNQSVISEFILTYLLSPAGRTQIISAASSTSGLHTLSVSKISALELNVPPAEEQSEIVRRVEKLFAFADRLEERLSQAQAAVQKLTPALLAKAFRGELVPQDPNDEPASELLKRLQESRTESANPSRARKPRTRKSP